MDDEDKALRALGNSIAKSILYIGIIILGGIWISSCDLDAETIIECTEACNSANSQMEYVTYSKCVCTKKDEETWIIPR
tara:strand:+ start:6656 stop:6892 length:237 start_codon:yes stop_codon:yes gene_type:complete